MARASTLFRQWLSALLLGLLLCVSALAAVLPVPTLTGQVMDQTGTLQPAEIASLDAKLKALASQKGAQVVVLMVDSTAPEDIFSYSNRVANVWKIGRKDVGDGVLIVVAKSDRRMRIEVAKTLEGAVTDISSGRIINEAMAPRFRANDFAGGIEASVDAVSALIRDEPLPLPQQPKQSLKQTLSDILPFAFLLVFVGMQLLRRMVGTAITAGLVAIGAGILVWSATSSIMWGLIAALAAAVMAMFNRIPVTQSGGWHSGGSGGWSTGGGSRSGGFSSGGGGNFGGGGASGSW